jgi:hypothetical protein
MDRDEATALLRTDPKKLMRRAYLHILGGNLRSGRHHFIVLDATRLGNATIPGFTTGISGWRDKRKDRPVFSIQLRRLALPGDVAGSDANNTVFAHYISMRQTNEAVGTTHYVLPANGGPDLMITSRLSGCMFGIGSNAANNRLVSHIQPDLSLADAQRGPDLAAAVTGGFAQVDTTFVRGGGYDTDASIIGIRRNGAWSIYAQHLDVVPTAANPNILEEEIGGVTTLL